MAQRARETTVDLPRLSRAATVVPNTINADARTVDVVWTTGSRVLRGFFDQYWEELSLDPKQVRMKRLNNGAPLLNAHRQGDANGVIGVVVSDSAAVDGKRGTATVRFARAEDDPIADQIFRKVQDGIIQNLSVGYETYRMEKVEDGKDKIPVYRATDWEPAEISVVPVGADDGAGFRSANTERHKCTFLTRQQETTMDPETPTNPSGESAAVAATRAAAQQRVEDAKRIAAERQAAAEEAQQAERVRSGAIRALARQHGMGETWAQNLVEAGTSVSEAQTAVLADLAQRDAAFAPAGAGAPRIGAGDDERDKWIRGASAWLIERTGYTDMVRAGQKALPNHKAFQDISFDPGEFRGMSPAELARQSLERNRFDTRGMDAMNMVGAAFLHKRNAATFQTTSDFALLLENVVNKVSLGAYATQENTWSRFCASKDVKDFRPSPQYRNGSLPNLDTILEHGEYHSGAIPDGAKYTIATGRLGKKFSLSREVIVNDDMGAVLQTAEQFGQASMRTLEVGVYALLLANAGLGPTQADTNPFFHSSRSNVGTGSALSVAGIDGDRVTLRAQKDPNGQDFLDLRPAILLVPDALYGQALVINEAQYDTDKIANARQQEPNRVRGLFRDVVSTPRLTGTRRYLFATTMDAIVVAFLQGYGRAPNVETMNGWNVDGVEWKVTLYAKAQMGDPKSALTNAGA